jgi:hypothetical protein
MLVDAANLLDLINAEAARRDVTAHIMIDIIHVIEYSWAAAWALHAPGDKTVEAWVASHARTVLAGRAADTATAITAQAKAARLRGPRRKALNKTVDYLRNKDCYLRYDNALASGWPIATGVIEGACRHLVKDRLDITGARWGVDGAEAVLKLRALRTNGDFDAYWTWHEQQEGCVSFGVMARRDLVGTAPATAQPGVPRAALPVSLW